MVNKIYLNKVSVYGIQDAIVLCFKRNRLFMITGTISQSQNSISSSEETYNSSELRWSIKYFSKMELLGGMAFNLHL